METTQEIALQDLALHIGKISTACLFIAWTIDTITTNANPPETETQRFEFFESINFILETMAKQLDDVHRRLNEEIPAR